MSTRIRHPPILPVKETQLDQLFRRAATHVGARGRVFSCAVIACSVQMCDDCFFSGAPAAVPLRLGAQFTPPNHLAGTVTTAGDSTMIEIGQA